MHDPYFLDDDAESVRKALDYWQAITNHIGWILIGFSRYATATYDTGAGTLVLNGQQRDSLIRAVMGGRERL